MGFDDLMDAVYEMRRERTNEYHRKLARARQAVEVIRRNQTPVEPEFYPALYENRSEMYTNFETDSGI